MEPTRRTRRVYDAQFKLRVCEWALRLPESSRIKPTCRAFPGVEPVQVRKWIRNLAGLQSAPPTAKLVPRRPRPTIAKQAHHPTPLGKQGTLFVRAVEPPAVRMTQVQPHFWHHAAPYPLTTMLPPASHVDHHSYHQGAPTICAHEAPVQRVPAAPHPAVEHVSLAHARAAEELLSLRGCGRSDSTLSSDWTTQEPPTDPDTSSEP